MQIYPQYRTYKLLVPILLFQALSTFHYDILLPQIVSEGLSVLDKFLIVGLEGWISRLEPWPHLHWIRARFWEIIFVDLHQFVTPALGVWHLFSLRGGNPHKYIHTQYTWTKKMNAKIFFVHRTKYHKSDYKFHHTDSYNHSRYLSCGLSCLGHSQVAENIRCLILIFWENNFVTEKATDRWSDNFASPLFWYVLSPVWLVGVCDDWKTISPWRRVKSLPKSFRRRSLVWILDSSLVLRL